MNNTITLEPGLYYVGDLCYVLPDSWDEACDLMFANNNVKGEGQFTLKDGRKFLIYSTAYGDGSYEVQGIGAFIGVDSGSIGIIKAEDIDPNTDHNLSLGVVILMDESFVCSNDNGFMTFGYLDVDTIGEDFE